jgi:hypothetical protein
MTLDSYVVAEMLQRLEQQGAVLRRQALDIATALSREEYPAALDASAEAHRLLDKFVATMEAIADHVVARDGLGELGEAFGELTLRARALVFKTQLGVFREALGTPAARERVRGWFVESHPDIDALTAFGHERLTLIHSIWTPYRKDEAQPPGMIDADRTDIYRTVIRVAQRALRELPQAPPLQRFLAHGLSANDLPEIQLACRQIVSVTGQPLDLDANVKLDLAPGPRPSRRLVLRPRRPLMVNGTPEKP